jgi:trans-aconitate methyltransferase
MIFNAKEHWDNIYQTKQPHEVSWTQQIPELSLQMIDHFHLPLTASIIDVGGGDSKLVDFLIAKGYRNITVLDISSRAIERAKQRLGEHADKVKWIVSDVLNFSSDQSFELWHDRAAFHFQTTHKNIKSWMVH